MRVIATVEARMGSTRLPGKTMMKLIGKPMLEILIERVRGVKRIDEIVVATTENADNDVIETLCRKLSVGCFRGSEDDVRQRVYDASAAHDADVVVKLTGDNPLVHVDLVEGMLKRFLDLYPRIDLITNGAMEYSENWKEKRTFPIGLNIQILKTEALADSIVRYPDSPHKEHATLDILSHPEQYRLHPFHADGPFLRLHRPELRLTVDTADDFKFVSFIFEALYEKNHRFDLIEVMDYIDNHPALLDINSGVKQHNPVMKKAIK